MSGARGVPLEAIRPRLSVCIPTYNFGPFIGETLDSILPQVRVQAPGDVEVLVVDGASTDNTESVVRARMRDSPFLRYIRLPQRGGIDLDMALSVEKAQGDYCWMFSADDLMRPGALRRAFQAVNEPGDVDVVIVQHSNCTKRMRLLGVHPVFQENRALSADLSDHVQRHAYFRAAATTEALFSFMSSLVIKRGTWQSAPDVRRYYGTCWAHSARLLAQSLVGPLLVRFIPEVWLDKRGENDSFMTHGLVRRLCLAVDGYTTIVGELFGPVSSESADVRRMLTREMPLTTFLSARSRALANPEVEDVGELDRIFHLVYADPGLVNRAIRQGYVRTPPTLYIPANVAFRAAGSVRQMLRRFRH